MGADTLDDYKYTLVAVAEKNLEMTVYIYKSAETYSADKKIYLNGAELTPSTTNDGSLTFEDLTLDVKSAVLKCVNGQSVRLNEKELRIMEYLIANQGRVLSREQIAVKIWGYESDSEYNNVEVYLSFVRKKRALRLDEMPE